MFDFFLVRYIFENVLQIFIVFIDLKNTSYEHLRESKFLSESLLFLFLWDNVQSWDLQYS